MNRKELLRDIMALDKALDDFLADLRTRASWDKSNIDDDGTVVLPCGIGVLHRLGSAREQLGKHVPGLASPAQPVDETERLRAHIAEQIEHVEQRIKDGVEMGATIWRIALEDVARENRAALQHMGEVSRG